MELQTQTRLICHCIFYNQQNIWETTTRSSNRISIIRPSLLNKWNNSCAVLGMTAHHRYNCVLSKHQESSFYMQNIWWNGFCVVHLLKLNLQASGRNQSDIKTHIWGQRFSVCRDTVHKKHTCKSLCWTKTASSEGFQHSVMKSINKTNEHRHTARICLYFFYLCMKLISHFIKHSWSSKS